MFSKRVLFAAIAGALAIGFAAPDVRAQEESQEALKESVRLRLEQANEAIRHAAVEEQYKAALQATLNDAEASNEQADDAPSTLWIGVQLADEIPLALAHHFPEIKGALVETVYPDSPASETGVEAYDLIVKLGDADVDSAQALVEAMRSAESKPMELVIKRSGKTQKLSVTPRERQTPEAVAAAGDNLAYATQWQNALVPHVRLLPGLQGPDSQALAGRIATNYFNVQVAPPLPESIESVTIRVERDGDKVVRRVVAHTVEGKTFEATGDEVEKLPPEVQGALSGLIAPTASGPFTFALPPSTAQPAPQAGLLYVTPHFAPGTPGVAVPPPPVAVAPPLAAVPQQRANAVWLDVFTQPHAQGVPLGTLAPPPTVAEAPVPLPPQPDDELKQDVAALKKAVERIEKLLQELKNEE